MKKYSPISLKKIRTYPLGKRKNKVSFHSFATPPLKGDTFQGFIDKLPGILAVNDFKSTVRAIVGARQRKKPVILGMGAHPIKVGLSPVIIDLMRRGIITAIATNGACIIHDFELSFIGHTSEDVEEELQKATFGMARETGRYLNRAIRKGMKKGYGIGKAVGELIYRSRFRFNLWT
jgi:hypothetical protein